MNREQHAAEAGKEIATLREQLQEATRRSEDAADAVREAEAVLAAAQQEHRTQSGQAAMLAGRLSYLEAQRGQLAEWEPGE